MSLRLYLYEKSPNELKEDCRFHSAEHTMIEAENSDEGLNSESSDGEGENIIKNDINKKSQISVIQSEGSIESSPEPTNVNNTKNSHVSANVTRIT